MQSDPIDVQKGGLCDAVDTFSFKFSIYVRYIYVCYLSFNMMTMGTYCQF
jgi:hypothetical protein